MQRQPILKMVTLKTKHSSSSVLSKDITNEINKKLVFFAVNLGIICLFAMINTIT